MEKPEPEKFAPHSLILPAPAVLRSTVPCPLSAIYRIYRLLPIAFDLVHGRYSNTGGGVWQVIDEDGR